jgi:hypothetical protein
MDRICEQLAAGPSTRCAFTLAGYGMGADTQTDGVAGLALSGAYGDTSAVFNPARYYAEESYNATHNPAHPGNVADLGGLLGAYGPFIILAVVLYLMETRRLKLGVSAKGSASA